MQPFDPLSPHKDCVVQSSFEITFLLKHILPHTVWQDYRVEGKIALPMTSLKTSWAISLSPFFVLRKFSIKCVADRCRMQKRCDKMATFGLQLAISQHLGLEWLPSSSKNVLTRIDLGDDYRPASFFPSGLVEPKVLVSKECAEGCRMQKGCRRMAKRLSWVIAGHQSPPGGLEWLPLGLKKHLARIDLGMMTIDPRLFFQPAWLNQSVGI